MGRSWLFQWWGALRRRRVGGGGQRLGWLRAVYALCRAMCLRFHAAFTLDLERIFLKIGKS
jgi:hypothetical protein